MFMSVFKNFQHEGRTLHMGRTYMVILHVLGHSFLINQSFIL